MYHWKKRFYATWLNFFRKLLKFTTLGQDLRSFANCFIKSQLKMHLIRHFSLSKCLMIRQVANVLSPNSVWNKRLCFINLVDFGYPDFLFVLSGIQLLIEWKQICWPREALHYTAKELVFNCILIFNTHISEFSAFGMSSDRHF